MYRGLIVFGSLNIGALISYGIVHRKKWYSYNSIHLDPQHKYIYLEEARKFWKSILVGSTICTTLALGHSFISPHMRVKRANLIMNLLKNRRQGLYKVVHDHYQSMMGLEIQLCINNIKYDNNFEHELYFINNRLNASLYLYKRVLDYIDKKDGPYYVSVSDIDRCIEQINFEKGIIENGLYLANEDIENIEKIIEEKYKTGYYNYDAFLFVKTVMDKSGYL